MVVFLLEMKCQWYEAWYEAIMHGRVVFAECNPGENMDWRIIRTSQILKNMIAKRCGKTWKYWNDVESLFVFGYGFSYTQFMYNNKNNSCKLEST